MKVHTQQQHKKCVVIIDDNEIDVFLTTQILQEISDIKCIQTFSDAKKALTYLNLFNSETDLAVPELIFLDINMPSMNGFEFLKEFSKLRFFKIYPPQIFVLSSTINPAEIERAEAYSEYCQFIPKPLTTDAVQKYFIGIR
ncbi:MAG: response regulator [Bacteroidota bacterium]|nr:response regulator [Bacteroidota bacterium]